MAKIRRKKKFRKKSAAIIFATHQYNAQAPFRSAQQRKAVKKKKNGRDCKKIRKGRNIAKAILSVLFCILFFCWSPV